MTFNDRSMSLTQQSLSELLTGVMNNFASLLNWVRNLANKNYLLNFKTNKVIEVWFDYTITARIDNTIMNIYTINSGGFTRRPFLMLSVKQQESFEKLFDNFLFDLTGNKLNKSLPFK